MLLNLGILQANQDQQKVLFLIYNVGEEDSPVIGRKMGPLGWISAG